MVQARFSTAANPDGVPARGRVALIAYEMACRLKRAGREVKLLVLFDAHGPGYRKLSAGRSQRLLGHYLEALGHLWLGVRLARRMPRGRLRFLGRYLLRLRRYYRDRLRAKFGGSGASMRGVGATHDPPSFPGTVTLIRASLQGAGLPDWPCLGWSRVTAKVDTVVVDGFHQITLFESPVVEQIAKALRPRIAE